MSSVTGRPLSEGTLHDFDQCIEVPTYDRAGLTSSIVHFGVGGFHRAHEALYLDDLFQDGKDHDWAITGVGLRPQDREMADVLQAQQCLYTLIDRSANEDKVRIIGSIKRYIFAPENTEEVLAALSAPETRIVSMTITEGGYNIDEATGKFIESTPAIVEDLQHPTRPSTAFGYICEALERRRARGLLPFTVLSCDNLQGNGHVVRNAILSFAGLRDQSLRGWIEANVTFPNSMVDRITPQTTDADRVMVAERFGIVDGWPVVGEPFRQWVIEDRFCNGRPAFENVGAQFVPDVHPYEMMKIRLLNASHTAMCYCGYLSGYRTIDQVMADTKIRTYVERMMNEEVTPLLPIVPGIDLDVYKRTLIERFSNPKIGDQVRRVCLDGSAKFPKFILDSINEARAAHRPHALLTLAVVFWFRYLSGEDEQGQEYTIQDPQASFLNELAKKGGPDPRPLLSVNTIFGMLGEAPDFVADVERGLQQTYRNCVQDALKTYLAATR